MKNPAAEAFWSKLEARYSQIKRTYDQTRVQAETESALLQDIQGKKSIKIFIWLYFRNFAFIENISKIEKKPANKKRKYILDISEIQSQRDLESEKLDTKLTVEDRL